MEKEKALNLALNLMNEHGLFINRWQFQWCEGKRLFGYCNNTKKIISLSLPLTELNSEEQVKDTILHEIAHALAPVGEGHGRIWKSICVKIGANPTRCYSSKDVTKPKANYVRVCTTCNVEHQAYRKSRRKVACGACCKKYNEGKYSDKFILKYKRNNRGL